MITLVKSPNKNIYANVFCRWQSNRQPFIFEFVRQDAFYSSITNYLGKTLITASTSQFNGCTIAVGDVVTINDNNGIFSKSSTILQVLTDNSISKVFTIDEQFSGNSFSGGFINFGYRENYRIEVTLQGSVPSLNQSINLGTIKGSNNSKGIVKIDVRNLVTYEMIKSNRFDFDTRNAKEYSGYLPFRITYQDKFILDNVVTSSANAVNDSTYYFAIDGVKNSLSLYGQNFADYYPYRNDDTLITSAKFLTEFPQPTYFVDFPFSLSFIVSDEILKSLCTSEEDELNVNGDVINHQDFNINTGLSKLPYLSQLLLSGNYNSSTQFVDVWINNGGTASDVYVADDYVANDYVYDNAGGIGAEARITEIKRVKINRDCRKNPIYLMWKNSLGGWDFWLFDNRSENVIKTKAGAIYDVYNEDIEREVSRSMIIENRQMKNIIVGDVVTQEDLIGLQGIEKSSAVYMLYDADKLETDPAIAWMMVNVVPSGFQYFNESDNIEVEVSFDIIEYYNVPN
jgi:hypothetical protein